jgi:hypothetical protein
MSSRLDDVKGFFTLHIIEIKNVAARDDRGSETFADLDSP